ncbi:MAG TPA: hypothetical protein VGG29_17015 [Caulobacteraceae bacterium]
MAGSDSIFDPRRLSEARALLAPRPVTQGMGGLTAAAAFFAVSALALAVAVVTMPTPWPR